MRRSIALVTLTLVLAVGAAACGSKKESGSSTPTLPGSGGVSTSAGGVTTASVAPASTFKPTEECSAINAFRLAEFGVGMAPTDKQQAYIDAMNSTAATVKTKVPAIADSIDPLVQAATTLSSTGATTPEQKTSVEAANAKVTEYWDANCV